MTDLSWHAPDPRQVVADGYDRLHRVYADWTAAGHDGLRHRYIDEALATLEAPRDALDLGCGTGRHATARLVELGLTVTGVDISPRSIDVAREEVPKARFVVGDMATVEFAPSSFDLIVAFYSLIHVPREFHAAVLARIATWLRPGGVAVVTMFGQNGSAHSYDDTWLDTARMYWSGWDADTNRSLVAAAGLEVISADIETVDEDGNPVSFLWVVGRRRAG